MAPAIAYEQQHRTAFGVAFMKDRREAALGFRPPQEGRDLEPRREPSAAHSWSGRVALIRAQQHGGERIAAAGAAHLLQRRLVPGHTADCRERL